MSEYMINIDLRGYSEEVREMVTEAIEDQFDGWAMDGYDELPEDAWEQIDDVINRILEEANNETSYRDP